MTLAFENDNDVIVHTLEPSISYTRDNQKIYLAQSICWISCIIGLQSGLITHIHNVKPRALIYSEQRPDTPHDYFPRIDTDEPSSRMYPSRVSQFRNTTIFSSRSEGSVSSEDKLHNSILNTW